MPGKKNNAFSFLLILLFLLSSQALFGQKLYQIVSVEIKEQSLKEALATISKKGDFYFSYSSNFIPVDSVVSISAKNHTVKEVLDELLSEKYEYKEAASYIILRPAPNRLKLITEEVTEKDNSFTVAGFVEDERTGAKIVQASVYEKRLLTSTLTDKRGYFKLKLSKREAEIALTVSKELYRDVTVVILPGTFIHPGNSKDHYIAEDPGKVEKTVLGRLLISSRQRIQSLNLSGFFTNSPFQASLIPGFGSHGIFNSQVINKFSLNLLGGYSTGVKGVEIAGGFNIDKGDVGYMQAAGIFNVVGGSVQGMQAAGVNNTVYGSVTGFQAAGVYNQVGEDFTGFQASGVGNINIKNTKSFQAAGAFNYIGGSFEGFQAAGAINIVSDSLSGFQTAGAINVVKGNVSGIQISGAFNAAKEVDGMQISGFLNSAKEIKGVQLGVINVAGSNTGTHIGLLNVVKGGYHKISISTNEVMNTNVAFKSGNSRLYTILSGGMHISSDQKAYSFGAGFGHDFVFGKKLLLSAEATSNALYLGSWEKFNNLSRVKTLLNFEVIKSLAVFAGPAFNVYITDDPEKVEGYRNIGDLDKFTFDYSKSVKGWLGFEAGITLF